MKNKKVTKVFLTVLLLLLCTVPLTTTKATEEDDIEDAIEAGLAYLAGRQNIDGSWGYWEEYTATTALVVLKFETYAIELGIDPLDESYIYYDQVRNGLAFIFSDAHIMPLSIQPEGDPDANGNGVGVYFGSPTHPNYDGHRIYKTSTAMMAIASSTHPEMVVEVLSSDVIGITYRLVLEDAVEYLAFAQTDLSPGRGGWGYAENPPYGRSDNSNSGYAELGLGFAEAPAPYGFGIPISQFVKDELNYWIDYVQEDTTGGSGYTDPYYWLNILKTGNLLYEMAFVGDTTETPRVIDAVNFIDTHWYDADYSPGWRGPGPEAIFIHPLGWDWPAWPDWPACYQAMYTTMKGLEVLGIEYISPINDPIGIDWFADFVEVLLEQQNVDGSWPGAPMFGHWLDGSVYAWEYWDNVLSTTWALLTLEKVVPLLELEVSVDIKPGSWPNPLDTKSKGVLLVAICGNLAPIFDVSTIDPASIRLTVEEVEGEVAPLRWSYEDVATPFIGDPGGGHDLDGDGNLDLVLHFDTQEVVNKLKLTYYMGETIPLIIKGNLKEEYGGTPINGQDFVRILGKPLMPFVIDDTGGGDYTWKEASKQWWCQGEGTNENPYIIKNVMIDGAGSTYCIYINNSDAHFIVMSCKLYGIDVLEPSAALILANTKNGVIIENFCSTTNGISILDSDDNIIKENDCTGNTGVGIYLAASNNNEILDNDCGKNTWGIIITGPSPYTIGVTSKDNLVIDNDCSNNVQYGILLQENSDDNLIIRNECSWNGETGLVISNADDNVIGINNCNENVWTGIILVESEGNIIVGSNCMGNYYGVRMINTHDNLIVGNTFKENLGIGAYVDLSSGNTFYSNYFLDNILQASDTDPGSNTWNHPAFTVGNYWSDWDGTIPWPSPGYDNYPSLPP